MIAYSELVIDQVARGNTEVFTSSKLDDLLGSADDMTLEVEVEDTTGSPTSITVRWYHSNSGKGFGLLATAISADTAVQSLPYRALANQAGPMGKFGRVGVTLNGGTSPTARVRVWVTGRTGG